MDSSSTEKHDLPPQPNRSTPPPSYGLNDDKLPDITAAFSNLDLSPSTKPTPDQCIAHLKLLEAIHQLREDTALTNGLWGLEDDFAAAGKTEKDRAELLTKIREKRWQIYVSEAARRFERWWFTSIEPEDVSSRCLKQSQVVSEFQRILRPGPGLIFDRTNLPPLDVIMVWHAYQLHPRDFLEDCIRQGKPKFWRSGLPWAAINSCIDNDSFEYDADEAARQLFSASTGYAWNSLDDPTDVTIQCLQCRQRLLIPRTKWNSQYAWETRPGSNDKLNGELVASGFADKAFWFWCQCKALINHELLKTEKFRRDLELLRYQDCPMPGTILNQSGCPEIQGVLKSRPEFFPNRLIMGQDLNASLLYTKLEETTRPRVRDMGSMSNVRSEIELILRDKKYLKQVNHSSHLRWKEKIAVRRMMSHYWDNSSNFGLDLVGAVIRQSLIDLDTVSLPNVRSEKSSTDLEKSNRGSFIEKMHSIDWIHSPAAHSTMQRLIEKYRRFIHITARHSNHFAVPTLDVDLAWHTHQLSPATYYDYTVAKTGSFIDHDDKIEETVLSAAFEWTSKTYQKMYGELYSECTCWYCEAIRESHTSGVKRALGSNKAIESQLDRLHAGSCDPNASPHISAHNAIKAKVSVAQEANQVRIRQKLERANKKAADQARKKGRTLSSRDDYAATSAYGYPIYLPYYAPYMADPCINDCLYAANPGCANFQPGGVGNCCHGTCGAGDGGGAGGCGGGCGG